MTETNLASLREFFRAVAPHLIESLRSEMDPSDLAGLDDEASTVFEQLLPELPYVDNPRHTMAESMFFSAVALAFVRPVRTRGRDIHCLGRATYEFTRRYNETLSGQENPSDSKQAREKRAREAIASQSTNDPREFIWEKATPA